jgi:hypothetical protein
VRRAALGAGAFLAGLALGVALVWLTLAAATPAVLVS